MLSQRDRDSILCVFVVSRGQEILFLKSGTDKTDRWRVNVEQNDSRAVVRRGI